MLHSITDHSSNPKFIGYFKGFLEVAEKGDAGGQYNVGWMYANGFGVKKDDDKAIEWYLRAAEQGDADAQFALGHIYERGIGVDVNYERAALWYLKAEKQGHEYAKYALKGVLDVALL